jgi:type I restriction enzyme M protein
MFFLKAAGETVRKKLLETTGPAYHFAATDGIFYKRGVKANVIFFA